MSCFQNKFKNIPVLLLFLVLGVFLIHSQAQALVAPQAYFTKLNISKNYFEPGESINGNVSLWNYEEFLVSDLVFYFQLLGDEIEGVPQKMIDEKKGQEVFALLPDEKITKSFSYALPLNLPRGDFKFRVQLATSKGEEMGWIDKVISIGGEGVFLALDNYWIIKDGQDLPPGGGVNYQPGEVPEIHFDVTNDSEFTITAFPKVITFKRNIGGEVIKTQREKSIIFAPSEKKTLKINLPQLEKPESYLSEVRFYDSESGDPISNSISFRWIISGEDAEILFVSHDKDSYQAGEKAKVQIRYTGPAHFEFEKEIGEGKIEVEIFNEKGELVGREERKVGLKPGQLTIDVPIEKNVDNPKIAVQIIKGKKNLDRYEFQVRPVKKELPEKIEEVSFFKRNKNLIVILIPIVLIIGAVIYFLKTKK